MNVSIRDGRMKSGNSKAEWNLVLKNWIEHLSLMRFNKLLIWNICLYLWALGFGQSGEMRYWNSSRGAISIAFWTYWALINIIYLYYSIAGRDTYGWSRGRAGLYPEQGWLWNVLLEQSQPRHASGHREGGGCSGGLSAASTSRKGTHSTRVSMGSGPPALQQGSYWLGKATAH